MASPYLVSFQPANGSFFSLCSSFQPPKMAQDAQAETLRTPEPLRFVSTRTFTKGSFFSSRSAQPPTKTPHRPVRTPVRRHTEPDEPPLQGALSGPPRNAGTSGSGLGRRSGCDTHSGWDEPHHPLHVTECRSEVVSAIFTGFFPTVITKMSHSTVGVHRFLFARHLSRRRTPGGLGARLLSC